MIRGLVIREARPDDRDGIALLVEAAFDQPDEARLVNSLVARGDVVLELVATNEGELIGHVLFSRLVVELPDGRLEAVALAPIAVAPDRQKTGVGGALIENAHHMLEEAGERLSVVLGDPAYYSRFGYSHERARQFDCDWQCEALQALAWGKAPSTGRLVYAPAFLEL